jgi:hypothetical protein
MTHVDDYIESPDADPIARIYLRHARQHVIHQDKKWLADNAPWVTWKGKQYRCVGASRLGDVWLKTSPNTLNPNAFYDYRVDVAELSEWAKP